MVVESDNYSEANHKGQKMRFPWNKMSLIYKTLRAG